MKNIKICPDCATEYFPHIGKCADCGAVLLLPEENKKEQEDRKRCMDKLLEAPVTVREGDLNWMRELYNVLIGSGIPCRIHVDTACKKGCCENTHQLMVSEQDARKATERIEEYYGEVHPEILASKEMASEDRCPACGSPVALSAAECPDCGLMLMIIE